MMRYPVIITLIGNAGYALMFLLIGPVPFLNIETNIGLFLGMSALMGTGFVIVMISTCRRGILAATNLGYETSVDNMFAVSGKEYTFKMQEEIDPITLPSLLRQLLYKY